MFAQKNIDQETRVKVNGDFITTLARSRYSKFSWELGHDRYDLGIDLGLDSQDHIWGTCPDTPKSGHICFQT